MRKVFIQLWADYGEKIAEVEVEKDESNLHAIANSNWVIQVGDTIKIVEEETEDE